MNMNPINMNMNPINNPNLITIIKKLRVPNVILRFIMMNFLDLTSIKRLVLTVKEMNILDDFSKDFLARAQNGFKWNCRNNSLPVAQWLYYNKSNDDVEYNICHVMMKTCDSNSNQLKTVQWLHSIWTETDKTGEINKYESMLHNSCYGGDLPTVQWIYSLCEKHNIEIFVSESQDMLNAACSSGHLAVAKWLYHAKFVHLEPELNENGWYDVLSQIYLEDALILCCGGQHGDIAKWLCSVDPSLIESNILTDSSNEWLKKILMNN